MVGPRPGLHRPGCAAAGGTGEQQSDAAIGLLSDRHAPPSARLPAFTNLRDVKLPFPTDTAPMGNASEQRPSTPTPFHAHVVIGQNGTGKVRLRAHAACAQAKMPVLFRLFRVSFSARDGPGTRIPGHHAVLELAAPQAGSERCVCPYLCPCLSLGD